MHEVVRRSRFGGFEFFGNLTFQFFPFPQGGFHFLFDLVATFVQSLPFRLPQRQILRLLHRFAVLGRQKHDA